MDDKLMAPLVNPKVKMSPEMADALGYFEGRCVARKVRAVSQADVLAFLATRDGADSLVAEFKPKMLLSTPVT